MEALVTIMNCSQSWLEIKTQLMLSPANGKPSPDQRQTQNYSCPLLRVQIKPQQFGREEAPRTDEEIMNFQWFDNVTWDSILRGATHVQPPPRFKFALQQAQHAILRAIMHNNPSSLASGPAWRALVLGSWLLLGRPAVNASESNCGHCLDARLDLFWAEDWPALWAMVRAECDVAPVHSTTRRTTTEQNQ